MWQTTASRRAQHQVATITVFVFQCTSIWNEVLFALVLGGYDSKPATIALNELAGTMGGRVQRGRWQGR